MTDRRDETRPDAPEAEEPVRAPTTSSESDEALPVQLGEDSGALLPERRDPE